MAVMRALRLSILLFVCFALASLSGQQAPVTMTHGPILGRLGSTEIGVWIRTSRPGTFRVRFGLDPQHLDAVSPPGRRTSTTTTRAGFSFRA